MMTNLHCWRALALVVATVAAVVAATVTGAEGVWEGPSVTIQPCTTKRAAYQQWTRGPKNEIVLKSNGSCLDVQGYSTADQATVYTFSPCHPDDPDPSHQNEAWSINANGTITELMSGKCLDRSQYGTSPGTQVWLYHCTGVYNQNWIYNKTDLTIRANDSGLCLDAGSPTPRTCDVEPGKSLPFCNTALSYDDRIRDLISRINDSDLPGLLVNSATGVEHLNLPAYQWWSEALHGVGHSPGVHFGGDVPAATSFPQVIHTGATFNKTLYRKIGTVISTEARAMNNVQRAGNTFWAPNINIIRDPRWGRGQETPGEDPFATGEYAANFVSGFQDGEDMNYIKASSCCKHFFDYNLENWHGVDRHHYNAIATDQDIADTYLPSFEACVRYGRASGLMCSYNAVNGVPSCANGDIMTVMARESWGFDGYITSDCGAVADVLNSHKFTRNTSETIRAVLEAGMDTDCGSFVQQYLAKAMQEGVVPRELVNTALHRLFMVQFRLGLFDPVSKQPYTNYSVARVNTPANQQLALEAAQQGIVLLKNTNARLPLKTGLHVALIGPNADATTVMQGNYQGTAPFLISPVRGFKNYSAAVTYAKGCDVACKDTSGFDAAVAAAKEADAVVVVVGLDQGQESEGHDRTSITLPGHQEDLVAQVAAAAKSPIVVFVMTGGAVDLSTIKANKNVAGILWCGYPGQSGGQAMADVVFGAVSPGGRLPYTIYPGSYVDACSMLDNGMRPNKTSGNPGRTYRFYTGKPVYEYGTGLSYTSFSYHIHYLNTMDTSLATVQTYVQDAKQNHKFIRYDAPEFTRVEVNVTNVGRVAGADVVQVFVEPKTPAELGAPIKTLIGFERVFLNPGQWTIVQFSVNAHDLTFVDASGKRVARAGEWLVHIGHDSRLTFPVHVN
ncbi:beta-glucosidase [Salpingoeca rosetta]|uniref:Beta-glucosidase n=1 Tax=Salpingoeca rosetta (strain ATCC 50818 / BSB-021) TaxID=946362 RepID=F2UIW6_SALR5|nr:beta-glucosidase [Salpingoeca rosetta]EGD77165.1 beta-glucosidase [Salpingoeca rosetta]|eukprot:XP_004991004.1 beta-glucosidase [Salpingoeca rosetta]